MKALLISDLHGNWPFLEKLNPIIIDYDVILCAGDLTNFGQPADYFQELENVISNKPFFWVSGNNDVEQSYRYSSKVLQNIDGQVIDFQGLKIAGLGGSYQNFESQNYGPSLIDKNPNLSESILLTHIPPSVKLIYSPVDISCLNSNETIIQLNNAPLLHICGHQHYIISNGGKRLAQATACLKGTKVVKMGPASDGYYASLDLDSLKVVFYKINL